MKLVPAAITRSIGRNLLKTKVNSPHIFFALGVVGVGVGTVLACRATLKLDKELDEIKTDIHDAKEVSLEQYKNNPEYHEKDYYLDQGYAYVKAAVRVGRLYGPPVIITGAAIFALTGSHVQLTRRNAALTATLASVMKAYEEYRGRVREAVGEEVELDLHRGVTVQELEINGKKELVKVKDPISGFSPYARLFDEYCPSWQKDAEVNRLFLHCQQTWVNDLLRMRGHVFLNDVYDALGMDRSQEGAVVGWLLNGDGDNYIDFGIYEPYNSRFINNLEKSVWLDFNVDGVIFNRI